MMQSITLSYHFLPHHIKPCFLYMGLFPVGYEFSPKKLAKLWTSEGFIKIKETTTTDDQQWQGQGQTEEEEEEEDDTVKAKEYLEELRQRCMIQEASKRYDGLPKAYRIHDVFRQMCIAEAQEYGFFAIISDNDGETTISSSTSAARRLAVHKTTGDHWYAHVTSSVSSILCFRGCTLHLSKLLSGDVSQLRVLHLEGSHIHEKALPESIEAALQLRYLNLRDTGIESLPSSIGKLVSLEFLDLRGNHIDPKEHLILTAIQKLTRLKELHMDSDTTSMDGDVSSSLDVFSLPGLRTLSIRAGIWMNAAVTRYSGKLKNFRLYGDLDLCPNLFSFISALGFWINLRFFRLGIGFDGKVLDLLMKWNFFDQSRMHSLELKRPLSRLPALYKVPSRNLTYLCLKFSQLKEDPMPILEQLPRLRVLRLRCGSFLGEKMVCSGGGFVGLEILELAMLNEFEEWVVEENAMPNLRRLVICCCNRLKMLPQGLLVHHHHLQELEVSGMPQTFNLNVEAWNKRIQHAKSIDVAAAADASNIIIERTTADGSARDGPSTSTALSSNLLLQVTDAADGRL